jgi:hypothetical protein
MPNLDARPADPRDARWELWNPGYRVYFWRRAGDAYASREFDVAPAEVDEVLAWIDEHRLDGETVALFAVVDRGDGLGIIRLAGVDPTRSA